MLNHYSFFLGDSDSRRTSGPVETLMYMVVRSFWETGKGRLRGGDFERDNSQVRSS